MREIITIKELVTGYNDKLLFNGLNLKINDGKWVTITGPTGSGKSTLLRVLLGLHKYDGEILIDGLNLKSDLKKIRMITGVVFEHSDESFVAETVMDEIAFVLENMNIKNDEIKRKVMNIANELSINHLLERNPYTLSNGEKQIVALASILVMEPKLLFLDEALTKINNFDRIKILNIIKTYKEKNHMTVINVTHDMEESVYGDDIIVINNGKVILNGKKELVYKEEKVFNKLGIDLPFMVKLSLKLKYYDLVDDIILDMDKLVDIIWK